MRLLSPVLIDEGEIPNAYAGANARSLPLAWEEVPESAVSLALILEEISSGKVHWLIYELDAGTSVLKEGQPREPRLKSGGFQGTNDFGNLGYAGPAGQGRRSYRLRLLALDAGLNLREGAPLAEFLGASRGHVLAEAKLCASYEKRGEVLPEGPDWGTERQSAA